MSTIQKTKRKKLDLGCAGISMTAAEFDAIEFFDLRFRYELIRGVLVVSRYPRIAERDPNEELGRFLRNYGEDHPQGETFNFTIAESTIESGENRRRADRAVWAGLGRLPILEDDGPHDLPTIAIEFVSASKRDWVRDYEEKRAEYLALGILEYWIINRFDRTMSVFRQPGSDLGDQAVPADGTYATPLLPGFELSLARLLLVADRRSGPKRRSRRGKPPGAG